MSDARILITVIHLKRKPTATLDQAAAEAAEVQLATPRPVEHYSILGDDWFRVECFNEHDERLVRACLYHLEEREFPS